ncbi:MAG TPA: FAD-dependent oxidoreductase, partial [Mycobacteriales bacterium]|nr:FAD-dependent oxidoreductase [Mycobacteriales bacterium]
MTHPVHQQRRTSMNVTILGAGHMGSAMAARLAETGHRVTVWDRDSNHAHQLSGAARIAPALTSAVG